MMRATQVSSDPEVLCAVGFPFYKKKTLKAFFAPHKVHFKKNFDAIAPGSAVAVWGATPVPQRISATCSILRLEDGFMRSVGLGADLIPPISWVADRQGMYFDATGPSDLEQILGEYDFPQSLLESAATLRQRIVAAGLTKYNVGRARWQRPPQALRVLLVLGQVETDASIKFGSPVIKTNLGFLKTVRQIYPDAYLVYKPHPDVEAGLRLPGEGEDQVRQYCDEIVNDADLTEMFEQVDEIHVLTSLSGFEALLRGKRVVCHGHPFYAGWGLTEDCTPIPRRTRRLSLDELVAGVLILYPRYMSLKTRLHITPEQAIEELLQVRADPYGQLPWWRRWFRPLLKRMAQAEDRLRKANQ
jgi:capsular polysaccharide export protein